MKLEIKKLEEDLSPTQKRVYLLLGAYGSLSVGDIAQKLEMPRSTASKTLNCLFAHGILDRETSGRQIKYSINFQKVNFLESQRNKIKPPLKDKLKDFLEAELLVTSYFWEKQSNPFDDTTCETASSLAPPESGYTSWVETHRILINDATLFEKDEYGILVKVNLTAFYSEGNEDDGDDVPEEEWRAESSIYYVRVQGENMNMEIEAME